MARIKSDFVVIASCMYARNFFTIIFNTITITSEVGTITITSESGKPVLKLSQALG
jgi:hypothetical protein